MFQIEDISDYGVEEYSLYHETGMYRLRVEGRESFSFSVDEGVETPVDNPEFIYEMLLAVDKFKGE